MYVTPVFFEPDTAFVNWLGKLAGDRIIFDIGFGSADFMKRLSKQGFTKLMGIDPYTDIMQVRMDWMQTMDTDVPHTFAEAIGEGIHMSMFEQMGKDKLIAYLCRPCHHPFLVQTSYDVCKKHGVELYYIGLEKNIDKDLGFIGEKLNFVEHDGTSRDGEVVIKLV